MPFWKIKKLKKGIAYNYKFLKKWKKKLSIEHTTAKRAVLSASMTVEAAFIVPMFVFFVVILIYVINLINFQNKVNEKLYDTVRTLSKTEYALPDSANTLSAMFMLRNEIGSATISNMGIMGGALGIIPVNSEFDGDMIKFEIRYIAKTPFDFLKVMELSCVQKAYVRKWIGNEDKGDVGGGSSVSNDVLVFITETGTVYHTNRDCTHLKLSIKSVGAKQIADLRNTGGGKYYACERCGAKGASTYYITDYGDRYHVDKNCSGLKRSVLTIPLSEVDERPLCSRCGK